MKSVTITLAVATVFLTAAGATFAAGEFEPGITLVDTSEVRAMLDSGERMLLINTLSPIEIRDKSIPGSVGMPYEFIQDGTAKLPADRSMKLVFYCKGPT